MWSCGVLLALVRLLVLDRRDQAQLAVQPALVVPVDVGSDRRFEIPDALPRALVPDEFGLED
jgi:hypothetical protein